MRAGEGVARLCSAIQLTQRELASTVRIACFRSFWFLAAGIGGPVLLVVGTAMSFLADPGFWLPFVLLGLFWSAVALYAAVLQPRVQYRRNRRLSALQSYLFSDSDIRITMLDSESRVQWSYFGQVEETRHLYAFRHQRRCVNPIPKRAFVTPADETAFRELIARKMKVRLR